MPDDTTTTSASTGATDTSSASADQATAAAAASDSPTPITGGASTDMEDDFASGFEPTAESEETEEVEAKDGSDAESESGESGGEEEETGEVTEEADADDADTRGKEILADRKAAADAAKAKEEAARAEAARTASTAQQANRFFTKADDGSIKLFNSLVTDYLPEGKIKIGESEVDLRGFAADNPEVAAIAGVLANNHLQQLVNLGVIPTSKSVEESVGKVVESKLFDFAVLQVHPDANELMDSAEYKAFYSGATPEIKALFDTDNPRDFIAGLNKFKGAKGATKAAPATPTASSLKKKAHDTLHTSTLRTGIRRAGAKPTPQHIVRVDGVEDEFAGAFNDAAVK